MLINGVSPPLGASDSVAVAVVAVVADPCPTFHREIRNTCHGCGEDTYYKPGIG